MVNDEEPKASTSTMEAVTQKGKQKIQGKKRKRQSSESSNDNEMILPDNALETERNVHISAIKNNLDETSVRKIIKKVVTNDHVLALVKLREEEDDSSTDDKKLQPKLTRAKVKELKKVSNCKSAAWDLEKLELTPINHIPVKTRPEVKALIAQELPDDEDDDEYEPAQDEVMSDDDHVESCSDLDSQPRTPATPATPSPRVVKDGPFKVPLDLSKARRKLDIEEEEATIALRTRSKLSLSSTSIEHIESTFVPPDDIPIQDVDDLWNEFLNECLNPASVAKNEDDDETMDETDPEYNVAADPDAHDEDEESLSKSIIKISKKELNDLVTELFSILPENAEEELVSNLTTSEVVNNTSANTSARATKWDGKQEPLSDDENGEKPSQKLEFEDDEEGQKTINNNGKVISGKGKEMDNENVQKDVPTKVQAPKVQGPRLIIDSRNKSIEISIEEREDLSETDPKVKAPPSLWNSIKPASETVRIHVDSTVILSQNQQQILRQQLRQHIQLATSNFMQTVVHPVHWKMAPQYKEYLTSLHGMAEKNEMSIVNVCNLKPAYELMTTWEASVTEDTEENREMIQFLTSQVEKCRRRISQNSLYSGEFHETFMKVIANSPVFLYPYLLPCLPYRPDSPRRFCYLHSEDTLITLGLAQFWPYVESNPQIFKLHRVPIPDARRGFMATVELVCKHMLPWMPTNRLAGHINAVRERADKHNPIYRYFKFQEVPKVEHTLLPFNPSITLYEQPEFEMPRIWVRYLAKTSQRFKKFYYKRPTAITGRQPNSVPIDTENPQETVKKPLPIDFEKAFYARSSLYVKQPIEKPTNRLDVDITKVGPEASKVVIPQNFYRLISTTSGHYLLPLQVTNTVNSTGPITTPSVTPTNVAKDITDNTKHVTKTITANTKIILDHMEHCMCCILLRKICKKRQSLITEFFRKEKEERKCQCNNINFPKISNRLRLLVRNCKKKSEIVFKELERRLIENEKFNAEKDLFSKELAFVLSYQLKVFTKASMSKRIYVKQRVSNLLSNFDLTRGDPEKLANELFKVFGTELVDCYMDFLCFLTPAQAESMGAFKDYFTRNCAEELMAKIEEQVSDKTTRDNMLTQLNSTLVKRMSPCEMCETLLGAMEGYTTLAQYTFNLFPHTREHRPRVCQTVEEQTPPPPPTITNTTSVETQMDANETCNTQQTMDYEADHSSSGEDSDALSVDLEASAANAQEEAEIYIKREPVVEENNPLMEKIIKTDDYSDSENTPSVMSEDEIKSEDTTDWTKTEDRIVLQVLQEHLTKEERKDRTIIDLLEEKNVYGMLFDCLDRSLRQIKERVLYLLTVLVVSERDN